MRPHKWSYPICVYELLSMWKCEGCGAILLDEDLPDDLFVAECELPTDCGDEAMVIVIHEAYVGGWIDPWADEKERDFTWPEVDFWELQRPRRV